jgi:DNA (cytosine-5)-methyltransferase 1
MAGIEVIQSYEWWKPAATTLQKNLGGAVSQVDIRNLSLDELPIDVDLVVGSPPCTQFSYSNRGGSGDIEDGLKDISKFLEVVEHLRPKYWVMENVPRVASILRNELAPGGRLQRFNNLVEVIEVVDCASFGVPQRRRRMLAGKFPFETLASYTKLTPERTLSDIVGALANDPVIDPVYECALPLFRVTDNEFEAPLNEEETRLNREAKQYHPVYNVMPFPEPMGRAARTVTATETRVSRESLIVLDPAEESCRRLTTRERACLQSFPISYQLFGKSFSDRQKMVGNAIPPVLTYHIGHSILGTEPEALPPISESEYQHLLPDEIPGIAYQRTATKVYPATRRFRAAIPHLRFGSGFRFDLSNDCIGGEFSWRVRFYFGASKDYRCIEPNDDILDMARSALTNKGPFDTAMDLLDTRLGYIGHCDLKGIQDVWSHRSRTGLGPFSIVDALGNCVPEIAAILLPDETANIYPFISELLNSSSLNGTSSHQTSKQKIRKICLPVFTGLLISAWFNRITKVPE